MKTTKIELKQQKWWIKIFGIWKQYFSMWFCYEELNWHFWKQWEIETVVSFNDFFFEKQKSDKEMKES